MTPREVEYPVAWGRLAGLRLERPGRPRVIALHGWLDNAASFLPLLPHLPELDLLLLDLPGHGRSGHLPAGAEYSLATHLHAVLDAADALGWERFDLLGHSMGAAIAALVAVAVPARVGRLALIETFGPLSEAVGNTATRLQQGVAASRALLSAGSRIPARIPMIPTTTRSSTMVNPRADPGRAGRPSAPREDCTFNTLASNGRDPSKDAPTCGEADYTPTRPSMPEFIDFSS